MQIKALSDATGVDVETIRYYEKQGLLPAPARRSNGYREYDTPHLERLAFIRHCRALDMPLSDVQRLLTMLDDPSGHGGHVDEVVAAQLARVRARLQSLRALEKQLLRLRERCHGENEAGACGILEELVSAAHGEACACHPAVGPKP
ncbi:MAG: Cd(II)/Pb(II)-responsive transcriptional regulator [Hydrogenophaga sp.]|uniref:Cd(II)/Pb(II)-responsive transcriptional regulator n=1 Tax=Hydrogenophaga sp. TaxID=1904254 RepID=UPI001D99F8EA|nr:Cd(II)/Pb(II)-responsive transcriptional regulator [Hydrogenophaga sp.]MBX3608874.1 Cd(II)/Pb(II)-responsive transcriptional regulator [Hydrogenophaga sp.]